jgi:hypothetical protein
MMFILSLLLLLLLPQRCDGNKHDVLSGWKSRRQWIVQRNPVVTRGWHGRTTSSLSASLLSSSIAFDSAPSLAFAIHHPYDLWVIRIASACLTYFGLVAMTDRPRGGLLVPESTLQIKESLVPGAGLGLYVTQDLPAGTILGGYPGVVLPLAQHAASTKLQQLAPYSEAYIWRFGDNKFIIDPTDPQGILQDWCRGGNPSVPLSIGIFATILSFVTVPTTLCRINEPPKGKDVNVITEEDLVGRKVNFVLERDCCAGEELYIDYGLSYDRSHYGKGGDGGW